jgi:hypothetical protein
LANFETIDHNRIRNGQSINGRIGGVVSVGRLKRIESLQVIDTQDQEYEPADDKRSNPKFF